MRDGSSEVVEPSAIAASLLREEDLEREIVHYPALLGEELLMLGSQLAEFAEDRDRLDVLMLDRDGELVLVELKASENFRVTDLQALAYAGVYASTSTEHLARTLQKTLERTEGRDVDLDEAVQQIVEWVSDIDEFAEWTPSQRVRIKLVAPSFPQRVLTTVKWLGDVYAMPIEAIRVQMYEVDGGQSRHLSFERLLPMPTDDQFGMTLRQSQQRPLITSPARKRPDVLRTLLDAKEIQDGAELWFLKRSNEFPAARRASTPDDHEQFRVRLDASSQKLRFHWIDAEGNEQELSPSGAWRSIVAAVAPEHHLPARPYRSVYRRYSTTPGGPTLGELAIELGLWPGEDELGE
jgi:hypothetical protein